MNMGIGNKQNKGSLAIIGLSVRCPGACNYHEFWNNVCNGKESISFYTIEELRDAGIPMNFLNDSKYVRASGELLDIDMFAAEFFNITPKEAELMDPQHRFFLECAYEALEDAGYNRNYKGKVGVYAGEGMNTYLLFNVFPSIEDKVLSSGSLEVGIGNDKDSLSTLVAYKLDLKGPALTIQSSSSTSLSAVCIACQGLLDHHCDMAIAGGVAIGAFRKNGFMYEEGGIMSPDGHCRPFDDGAHGLVPGNGIGIVVIKRLEDALADRDNIYAIIKGFALNNDGSQKISYSAPSVNGQAEVIIGAHHHADVSPDSISYVETHGTGTYIGDPIEIRALKKAFAIGTDKKSFCAIGSVKANIGHLDSAAGVLGLIKVALSLKYKLLPPQINFNIINKEIDLVDSPFYINDELIEWPCNINQKRRGGVTSIGMGGTNAHVILEEYNNENSSASDYDKFLLPISAKSEIAAHKMAENIIEYINHNNLNLSDVAYTLQFGRNEFLYRVAIIAVMNETNEIQSNINELKVHQCDKEKHNVYFIYGDENNKWPAEFYEHHIYRTHLNECVEAYLQIVDELSATELLESIPDNIGSFIDEYCVSMVMISLGVFPNEIFVKGSGIYTALCVYGNMSVKQIMKIIITGEANLDVPVDKMNNAHCIHKISAIENYSHSVPKVACIKEKSFPIQKSIGISFDSNFVVEDVCFFIPAFGLCELIGELWCRGLNINWHAMYQNIKCRKVSLPTYPFERKKYWIDNDSLRPNKMNSIEQGVRPISSLKDIVREVKSIWKSVLGVDDIDENDRFFDLGGDSRKLVILLSSINRRFPDAIQLYDLLAHPSVAEISNAIFSHYGNTDESSGYPKANHIEGSNDIAVIGISVRMPSANNINEFWHNLKNEKHCIVEYPRIRKNDSDMLLQYTYLKNDELQYNKGGYIDRIDIFDNEFFKIPPKEARLMDPCQRIFLEVAYEAIEDSGYNVRNLSGKQIGVYIGYAGSPIYGMIANQIEPPSEFMSLSANLASAIASRVSYIFDLRGPAILIDTACSSSLVALHQACESLKSGECEAAIVGGANLRLLPIKGNKSDVRINIMDSNDYKTKSFNDNSDGTVWGEGIAAVIIKPLDAAIKDSDNIYAVIKSTVVNQDGKSIGMSAPNVTSQIDMLTKAWDKAGVPVDSLSYIEAHGSGTLLGDSIEINAIDKAISNYTNRKQFCGVGSVKTNIGHTDATSGLAGFVKLVLSLKNNEIPPSLHFTNPSRLIMLESSPVYFNDMKIKLRDGVKTYCGISSFGLSGTNSHAVVENYVRAKEANYREQYIFVTSAKSETALIENIRKYITFLNSYNESIYDLCYTASVGREHFQNRVAIIFKNIDQLRNRLVKILEFGFQYYHENEIFCSVGFNNPINDNMKSADIGVCNDYISGVNIDWELIYPNGHRVSLPTYSFERRRNWLEVPQTISNLVNLKNNFLYHIEWKAQNAYGENSIIENIVFFGTLEKAKCIFPKEEYNVYVVQFGDLYEIDFEIATIRNIECDFVALLNHLKKFKINKIIYSLIEENDDVEKAVFSLYYLNKAFVASEFKMAISDDFEIVIITENSVSTRMDERVLFPERAMAYGVAKTLNLESNYLNIRCIDIDKQTQSALLKNEIENSSGEFIVAFRDNIRYIQRVGFVENDWEEASIYLRQNGVYVIAGGMGSIGFEIVKYLSSLEKVSIIILCRTNYSEQYKRINDSMVSEELREKLSYIMDIEKAGSKVQIISCDISNESQMNDVMNSIVSKYGRIDGIINSAGVNVAQCGKLFVNESIESLNQGFAAKVNGSKILEKYAKINDVDFYVIFTSPITLTSGIGMGIYTIANTFIDAFVEASNFDKITAIGWAPWENTVKKLGDGFNQKKQLFKTLYRDDMLLSFSQCINMRDRLIEVGRLNINSTMFLHDDINYSVKFSDEIMSALSYMLQKANDNECLSQENREITITGHDNGGYTELEITIGKIVGYVLGYDSISIYDNFYELGGDSIHALKAVNKINDILNTKLELSELLKYPTVVELAKIIEEYDCINECVQPIGLVREERSTYDVTPAQRRLLIHCELNPHSTAYNITVAKKIQGELDVEKLKMAFSNVIQHHDVFRSYFEYQNGKYTQTFHSNTDFELQIVELTDYTEDDIISEFIVPFDLSKPPLIRAILASKKEKQEFLLVYDIHHLIADGISVSVFEEELINEYFGVASAIKSKQYEEYLIQQSGIHETLQYEQDRLYWVAQLGKETSWSNIPTDFPRPAIQSHEGSRIRFKIDEELTLKLRAIAEMSHTTIYSVLLAILNVLLYKYTNQNDILIGTPISGRRNSQFEETIGFFVNTIVLRNCPQSDKVVLEFIEEVKQNCIEAFKHQNYPFDELPGLLNIKRDFSRNPFFDVFFSLQNFKKTDVLSNDLRIMPYVIDSSSSKFDLSIEAYDMGHNLIIEIEYCTKLFKRISMERFASKFLQIAINFARLEKEQKLIIDDIKLTENDKNGYCIESNNRKIERYHVIEYFENQVSKNPEAIAISCNDDRMSYIQLYDTMICASNHLKQVGITVGTVVGIMIDKSFELIAYILALFKLGAVYMPLDENMPINRIEYMIDDSGCEYVITKSNAKFNNAKCIYIDDVIIGYSSDHDNEEAKVHHNSPAYIMYTSGSTGRPKGIVVEHCSLSNFISSISEKIRFDSNTIILSVASISFDISILELIVPLCKGSTVVLASLNQISNIDLFTDLLHTKKINILQMTPSRLRQIVCRCKNHIFKYIEHLLVGGEVFSSDLLMSLRRIYAGRIYNLYGPTEATIWCSIKDLTFADKITIGTPLSNIDMLILSNNQEPQSIGVQGEIYIKGDSLSRGYLNAPEITYEKFVLDNATNKLMYKTGDIGRWLDNGDIEFLGRSDNQVKINGYRVELDEINACAMKTNRVKECVTIVRKFGEKQVLCTYYTSEMNLEINELKDYMIDNLPYYMAPNFIIRLSELPINQNGKTDYKLLPDPIVATNELLCVDNDIENALIIILSDILNSNFLDAKKSVFELGANSMDIINLVHKIHEKYNVQIPLVKIFKLQSIEKIAHYIKMNQLQLIEIKKIPRAPILDNYPVTVAQNDIYWFQHMNLNSTSYNMPMIIKLNNTIDLRIIERSINTLNKLHDALRLEFHEKDGTVFQRINNDSQCTINMVHANPGREKYTLYSSIKPFVLSQAPLYRLTLVKTESVNYLVFDIHHIIADGFSMKILLSEFLKLINNQEIVTKSVSFIDYVMFINTSEEYQECINKQKAYWESKSFSNFMPTYIKPDYDIMNSKIASLEGNTVKLIVDEKTYENINKTCMEFNTTKNIVMLCALYLLLFKETKNENVLIGIPFAGRSFPDVEQTVGMFINTLPISSSLSPDKVISDLFDEVAAGILEAIDNQNYPIQNKILTEAQGNSTYHIMYTYQDSIVDILCESEFNHQVLELPQKDAKCSLEFEVICHKKHFEINAAYRVSLYKKSTIVKLLDEYITILNSMVEKYSLNIREFFKML